MIAYLYEEKWQEAFSKKMMYIRDTYTHIHIHKYTLTHTHTKHKILIEHDKIYHIIIHMMIFYFT